MELSRETSPAAVYTAVAVFEVASFFYHFAMCLNMFDVFSVF